MICSPESDLAFSQVREDPRVEMQVVQRLASKPLRVLLVASGGCSALSLLSIPTIAHIAAIDLNPAQIHLVELRRQALLHLPLPDQLQLIEGKIDPLGQYDQIRSYLPDATQTYWDDRRDQIAYGVNRVGKFEALFRELADRLADLDPLHDPINAIQHPQWRERFELVFDREKLIQTFGAEAVHYSMDRSFGEHFATVFAEALQRFDPTSNYFLTQALQDCYAMGIEGYPPYLQAEVQTAIRQLGTDRLHLHQGQFAEKMLELAESEKFDLIQISNISDWMPLPDLHKLLAQTVNCLKPGGAVMGRRLNGDHHLASVMACHLEIDRASNTQLKLSDRSFFYPEVVVGWHSETEYE